MGPAMIVFAEVIFLILFIGESDGMSQSLNCKSGQQGVKNIEGYDFSNIYSIGYNEGEQYPQPISCVIDVQVKQGNRIRIIFNYIDIALNPACMNEKLVVEDYVRNETIYVGQYCGKVHVNDYLTSQNRTRVHFLTTEFGLSFGFNITFKEVSETNLCKPGEFLCRSRKCISDSDIRCNGKDDCGDGTDEEDCDYPVLVSEKCGTPEVKPLTGNDMVDRVVGGREAIRGSWPWQVDMQVDRVQPNGHFCGGTLLNAQWFVTAAHCVVPFRTLPTACRIHLGNHHKYKQDPYEQIRYMKEYFVYGVDKEQFLKTGEHTMTHDIALVKLNAPVKMNPHVQVACLPELNEELKVGQRCFSTGWGLTRGTKSESVLKQVVYPVQNASKCNNIFVEFENATMICAGLLKPLSGLCHGDSGGPLVCEKNEKWHVYGATSFITDTNFVDGLCGIANTPSVFNKISAKIDWIRSTIQQNS